MTKRRSNPNFAFKIVLRRFLLHKKMNAKGGFNPDKHDQIPSGFDQSALRADFSIEKSGLNAALKNLPYWEFSIALLIHIIFLLTVNPRMNIIQTEHPLKISFLGSILDASQILKLKPLKTSAHHVSTVIPESRKTKRDILSLDKPKLDSSVNKQKKTSLKSNFLSDIELNKTPPANPGHNTSEAQTILYQRLQLYP